MEDKLLVIKESDLDKLTKSAGVTYPTFPASEVFEAARGFKPLQGNETRLQFNIETYTDYEKSKLLTNKI